LSEKYRKNRKIYDFLEKKSWLVKGNLNKKQKNWVILRLNSGSERYKFANNNLP